MEKFITLEHLKKALLSLKAKIAPLEEHFDELKENVNKLEESPAAEITSTDITNWNNKTDVADLNNYMQKGVDYVTAGRKSGTTVGPNATAEGLDTTASSSCSHAEGYYTTASSLYAHAEGNVTTASGSNAHAEGDRTTASGNSAHAEGYGTTASGRYSHTEGHGTTASSLYSHAEGYNTTAQGRSQHVFGEFNTLDTTGYPLEKGTYIEMVGNGTAYNARSNARTLDWSGNETLAGKLTLGSAPTENMDATTKQYVDTAVSGITIPVTSVNGQTGDVSLTIPTVPTNISDFTNDADYQNSTQVNSAITTAIAAIGEDAISDIPVATHNSNGLMSAADKQMLDNMNPNISVTISDIYASETHIINAKQENMVDLEIIESPHISQQIRTSNLLNVDNFTPGFYIGSNGALSSNTNDHVGDFIPVSPGDDIYYTGIIGPTNSGSINRRLHVYDATQKWIKQLSFAGGLKVGDHWSTNGTVPSNGAYIRVSWGVEDTNVMISVGAPDKYWPYYITPFSSISSASFQLSPDDTYTNATTYTVTVPTAAGDLYGFKYNPIAGKLYATMGHIASYNGEVLPNTEWYSDRDVYEEGTSPSTGAEVIYQLADEDVVEYDITPQTIPMFFHANYLKIDTGVIVSFSYYAETFGVSHITISNGATIGGTNVLESDVQGWNHAAESIDSKADLVSPTFTGTATAPTLGIAANSDRIATAAFVQSLLGSIISQLQVGNKATKNYEVGDYFIYNGILYKVTAAIAQGGAITPGTNVEATTVMAEIVSLLS